MSFSFAGKVVIVTGAGGGLGFAYASYLARLGARVVINDLGGGTFGVDGKADASVAEQAAERIRADGGEAVAIGGSVANFKTARRLVDKAIAKWGRVDAIINNAGIASTQVFPDVDPQELHRHLDVHVIGSMNLMKAAWPHMVKQQFGRIVNTASSSMLGFSPQISYPSMKAALLGLSNNVALLGKANNIHVNAVLPAAFTRLSAMLPDSDFRTRLENEFQPEKLAPVLAYLCHESCDVNGEFFTVGGGKVARLVFAETAAAQIDMTVESVAQALNPMMDDSAPLQVMHSSFDDLANLGFSEEEYQIFYNMSATTDSTPPEFENFAPVTKESIDQVWNIVVKSPVGDQRSVVALRSEGKRLLGHVTNEQYGVQIAQKGELSGGNLVWKTKISKPVPMTLTYTGSVDDKDNMMGTMKLGMFGEATFTATPADEVTAKKERLRWQEQQDTPDDKSGFIKRILQKLAS